MELESFAQQILALIEERDNYRRSSDRYETMLRRALINNGPLKMGEDVEGLFIGMGNGLDLFLLKSNSDGTMGKWVKDKEE